MPIRAHIECFSPGETVCISEAASRVSTELMIGAHAIHDILSSNWQRYVDQGQLSATALRNKLRAPEQQAERMASDRSARYFFLQNQQILGIPDQVRGFVRIESYTPRLLGLPYPNISDLEMRAPIAEAATARDARMLLYHALRTYKPDRKVAAYVEEPNDEARQFFDEAGFIERRLTAPEALPPDSSMRYVHLQADKVSEVTRDIVPEHSFSYL